MFEIKKQFYELFICYKIDNVTFYKAVWTVYNFYYRKNNISNKILLPFSVISNFNNRGFFYIMSCSKLFDYTVIYVPLFYLFYLLFCCMNCKN